MTDVRSQFPQLRREVNGQPLIYLDSAATALKPLSVIEAVRHNMAAETANVHRGAHRVSDEATGKYEATREKVRRFVNAREVNEIVFTHGTTDGLNLLASSLGRTLLNAGDEVLLSQMEHHSNIVPWQRIAEERGARVRFIPVNEDGTLGDYASCLSAKVKIVSLVHLSNALGTLNPVRDVFRAAHAQGAVCVLDAAQSSAGLPLDVQQLGCDFLVFSGHKVFAPTGVGILYGKAELLNRLPPYQSGGSMISEVREEASDYLPPPHRFEAGTPPIGQIIGLSAALDFISELGYDWIGRHEREIYDYAVRRLSENSAVRFIGEDPQRLHALSFLFHNAHPSDVGAILDQQGIAVRTGHHCCQPLMRRLGISGTIRVSFSVYSSLQDVDALIAGLNKAQELLL